MAEWKEYANKVVEEGCEFGAVFDLQVSTTKHMPCVAQL
jgi:hypothetical protein